MAKRNYVDGDSCFLFAIPAYASHIFSAGNGLAGEITVPPNSLEFWNCTGKPITLDGKNCLELASTNEYRFDKDNLLNYMKEVQQEYASNTLHDYDVYDRKVDSWKNVNENGWITRYQKIKRKSFDTNFVLYMKPTDDTDKDKGTRYYVSSKSENYLYVIAYCIIPGFTNIRIDRKKRKDGGFTFTFLLEAVGFSNTEKVVREEFQKQEEQLAEESIDRLYNRAKGKSSRKRKTEKTTTTTVYDRDPEISAYVKKRAEGKCDLCGKDAPFKDKKGYPYLEEHHVIRLADGGEDTINNAVALCPNCHREVHIVKSNDTNKTLRNRLIAYSEFENKYNQ